MKTTMFTIKKNSFFIAIFLLATVVNAYSMELILLSGATALNAIAFKYLKRTHHEPKKLNIPLFSNCPKEVNNIIFNFVTEPSSDQSLRYAAKNVYALSLVNKDLNNYFDDSRVYLDLIKTLAKKYKDTDGIATYFLPTKEGRRRYDLQREFHVCWSNKQPKKRFEYLYNKGADLDFTYDCGETLLIQMSIWNRFNTIDCLLEKGADVNKTNKITGETALMAAAKCKGILSIERLLKTPGILIDNQDCDGNTALIYSITGYGNDFPIKPAIIKALLNAGADPTIANFAGVIPMQLAQKHGSPMIIKLIEDAIEKKKLLRTT